MNYTKAEHAIWQRLYERMLPRWKSGATPVFLDGLAALNLEPGRAPSLSDINQRLAPLTGFQAIAVDGYMPAVDFFAHLRRRQFPTVTKVRREDQMDYLPEPDLFHDVAGHVPMHTNRVLASFGALAEQMHDDERVSGALARFFWYTIEFGLMDCGGTLKAYGSGVMSSLGELDHALHSSAVERRPFDLKEVIATPFEIDRYQNRLYVVDSFEQLYDAVKQLRSSVMAQLPEFTGS